MAPSVAARRSPGFAIMNCQASGLGLDENKKIRIGFCGLPDAASWAFPMVASSPIAKRAVVTVFMAR
jgi:hypothetical protein